MRTGWTLIEPCCGTAALTWHLLGGRRQLVPRQGSKWRYRHVLAEVFARLGFEGAPSRVVLTDAQPWPHVLAHVLMRREELLVWLSALVAAGEADPAAVHAQLVGSPVPLSEGARLSAELLWLQRMAWGGKSVRVENGCWWSPGLNQSSAYGRPETHRADGSKLFGEIRPLGPALLREVRRAPRGVVEPRIGLARPDRPVSRTLVYLDPDYVGTTGYGCSLPRTDVVDLATEWTTAGATVVVSEAGPVAELVARGWHAQPIRVVSGGGSIQPFRGKHGSEWITWAGPPQLELPWGLREVSDAGKRQASP